MHEGERPTIGVRSGGARDPRSLVSTRLTRELIAADALCDLEHDEPGGRPAHLLDAVLAGMHVSLGALLRYPSSPGPGEHLASRGVAPAALELLAGRDGAESLALRACAERRVFLLDRASREPLMSALRGEAPDLAGAAVVPLYDRGLPVAALVVGASDPVMLHAAALRLLSPAFHLLGVLLAPSRFGALRAEDPESPAADGERYLVEIEELGNLLREAREALRVTEERAAASEAALRAEVQSYRARIGELEASLSRGEVESSILRDLEAAYTAQTHKVEERGRRMAELEEEVRLLQMRLSAAERERAAEGEMAGRSAEEAELDRVAAVGGGGDLQEIADLAAAALERDDEEGATEPLLVGIEPSDALLADGDAESASEEEAVALESSAPRLVTHSLAEPITGNGTHAAAAVAPESEVSAPLVVLAIESNGEACAAVRTAAEHAHALAWLGEGAPPAGRGLLTVNLFDRGLNGATALLESKGLLPHGVAYGYDAESESGLVIGKSTWLGRPLDVERAVGNLRAAVPGKINGILIVSSHLRELAPLRDALSTGGIASSVACDSRQALDLLEIVRRPDALLIDLALADGGLPVAAQCRGQDEMRTVPILLLLPENPDPEQLLAAARRCGILAPFAPPQIARVLSETLLEP